MLELIEEIYESSTCCDWTCYKIGTTIASLLGPQDGNAATVANNTMKT